MISLQEEGDEEEAEIKSGPDDQCCRSAGNLGLRGGIASDASGWGSAPIRSLSLIVATNLHAPSANASRRVH
jgi:hypothetical protein